MEGPSKHQLARSHVQGIPDVTRSPPPSWLPQWKYLEDGTRVRVAVGDGSSGSIIPFPIEDDSQKKVFAQGPKDTPGKVARKRTFDWDKHMREGRSYGPYKVHKAGVERFSTSAHDSIAAQEPCTPLPWAPSWSLTSWHVRLGPSANSVQCVGAGAQRSPGGGWQPSAQ